MLQLKNVLAAAFTLLIILAPFKSDAQTKVVSYEFEGRISSFTGSGTFLTDNFDIGDAVSGQFCYLGGVEGPSSGSRGFFDQSADKTYTSTVNGIAFTRGSNLYRLQTTNISDFDRLEVLTFDPTPDAGLVVPSGHRFSSMTFDLQDSTGGALINVDLPTDLVLEDWTSATMKWQFATPSNTVDGEMFATITSLNEVVDCSSRRVIIISE